MKTFDSPVFVKSGNHLIEEISCLEDALEFLDDWPKHRRGSIYTTALKACRGVLDHNISLNAARSAFAAFAKSAGILETVDVVMPWARPSAGPLGGTSAI